MSGASWQLMILRNSNLSINLSCHSFALQSFLVFVTVCNKRCKNNLKNAPGNWKKTHLSSVKKQPLSLNPLNNCFILYKNTLSRRFWVHKGGSRQFNNKCNQLFQHPMKWLSKQNCIIIHVTAVYITFLENVTDTFLSGITVVRATSLWSLWKKTEQFLMYHS